MGLNQLLVLRPDAVKSMRRGNLNTARAHFRQLIHKLMSRPDTGANPEQEFYVQLSAEERFSIVRLTPEKALRVVKKLTIILIRKEVVEESIEVQIFLKQMTQDRLHKIWPMKHLVPGNMRTCSTRPERPMQVWDFAIEESGGS